MIHRKNAFSEVKKLCSSFPVTAILGARQCGKTTLAASFNPDHHFDLENPRDIARLRNPQLALENLTGLIMIDEIQRMPELFPLLRFLVDTNNKQRYMILGSASRHLLEQSSESLAGRIAFFRLGGFTIDDIGSDQMRKLWLYGGYPRSFLASGQDISAKWRDDYITTFLERDIPQLGINIPARTLRRFWIMLSHYHGQVLNMAELGRSFGISDMTVRKYLEILEGTYMIRLLQPWLNNTKKRLVKSPKLFIRDSGIFHALQAVVTHDQLFAHNKLGASWEGFAMEQAIRALLINESEFFFWATHNGAELDLFFRCRGKKYGVEFKCADAPVITKSMNVALKDLDLEQIFVIYPGTSNYKLNERVTALPVWDFCQKKISP